LCLQPVQNVGSELIAINLVEHFVTSARVYFYGRAAVPAAYVMHCEFRDAPFAADRVIGATGQQDRQV